MMTLAEFGRKYKVPSDQIELVADAVDDVVALANHGCDPRGLDKMYADLETALGLLVDEYRSGELSVFSGVLYWQDDDGVQYVIDRFSFEEKKRIDAYHRVIRELWPSELDGDAIPVVKFD